MRKIVSLIGLVVIIYFHLTTVSDVHCAGPAVGLIGTLVSAAATVLGGFSAYQQGKTAEALAEYNATVAEREGKAKEKASEIEAQRFQRQAAALEAEQVAAYGKSGVTFRGSPLTVMAETAKNLELDRQMILQEGLRAREFAEAEAHAHRLRGQAAGQQGRYAMLGSFGQAGSIALSGFGDYRYRKSMLDYMRGKHA